MSRIITALNHPDFLKSLSVMGQGMLAIFIVMICIMLSVVVLNKISSLKKS